jgi:hypothetical protein
MRAVLPDERSLESPAPGKTADHPAGTPSDSQMDSLANLAAHTGVGSGVEVGPLRKGPFRSKCLLAESMRNGAGVGPDVALEDYSGKLLVVTLGITDVMERMGLSVSVWGSEDLIAWGSAALVTFRQRQYCGVYSVLLNLARYPEVRYLRVHWDMSHLGRGERGRSQRSPLFGFQVFLEESGARVSSSAVA